MTYNVAINDDALRRAIKAALPEPGAAYEARLKRCLEALPAEKEKRTVGRLSYIKSRPLLAAALILLLLALSVVAAFAFEALYRNVFGRAIDSVNESMEQHQEHYEEVHEQMENMTSEEAAIADTELDGESDELIWHKFMLEQIDEHSVRIGAPLGKLKFSEFAACDYPGTDEKSRYLYIGIAAQLNIELPEKLGISVDGMEFEAEKTGIAIEPTETEQYAIYECRMICSREKLNDNSLIAVADGDNKYCFSYCWQSETATLPDDEAKLAEWLELIEAMKGELSQHTCELAGVRRSGSGISFEVTNIEIVNGNELLFEAAARPDENGLGKYYFGYGAWLDTHLVGDGSYAVWYEHVDYHFTEDCMEGKLSVLFTLPFDADEVSGEKHTLHLRIYELDDDPRYGGGNKKIVDYYFDLIFR